MLQAEEREIWRKRAEVTRALSAAAAEGDRSENAEYIYRKKQLREIDRRIRYLQKRLPELNVVDRVGNEDQVFSAPGSRWKRRMGARWSTGLSAQMKSTAIRPRATSAWIHPWLGHC